MLLGYARKGRPGTVSGVVAALTQPTLLIAKFRDDKRGRFTMPLSPLPWRCATIRGSLAGDGAFGSSTQRGKRPAPGKKPSCWGIEIQEAWGRPLMPIVSNGGEH